jgi:5-methylcytosine-specific restriction endonuclease McrA
MSEMPALTPLRHAGSYPALVLNADFAPLSTFPLSVWPWTVACHAVITDRVIVVREHNRECRSAKMSIKMPSVVALKQYIHMNRTPAFTRGNMLLRDQYSCCYCGHRHPSEDLTFDHVIPRAIGGKTSWENIVLACGPCNVRKACRTPEQAKMPLNWRPWKPSNDDLAKVQARFRMQKLHEDWKDFIRMESEQAA